MKTIVVSGARSNVGKTTLAHNLMNLLPNSVFVKIGHHQGIKPGGDLFFEKGTTIDTLLETYKNFHYLIIESNSILNEFTPDCSIFLPADSPKSSAFLAEKKADIIRGQKINESTFHTLAIKLGIEPDLMQQIVLFAGASSIQTSIADENNNDQESKI